VVHSWDEALKALTETDELMIIGGAELYRQFLPHVQRVYLTLVHAKVEGDSYFPELKSTEWRQVSCEDHPADEANQYPYSFMVWERI
jgi:dihydrofolate reductase